MRASPLRRKFDEFMETRRSYVRVQEFVRGRPLPEWEDSEDWPIAIVQGYTAMFKLGIINIPELSPIRKTLVKWAPLPLFTYLLDVAIDPNERVGGFDMYGNPYIESPLHAAVRYGDVRRVKLLLQKDRRCACCLSELNKREGGPLFRSMTPVAGLEDCDTISGRTPLHVACEYGRRRAALLIVTAGTNEAWKDAHRKCPYDLVNSRQAQDPLLGEAVRLVAEGKREEGVQQLRKLAAMEEFLERCEFGDARGVETLIRAGVDVNDPRMQHRRKDFPLHRAAERGRIKVMRILLRAGAVVDARNRYKLTPLHLAAEQGQAKAVRLLLAAGADPSLRSADGDGSQTALHFAVQAGSAETVRELVNAGADVAALSAETRWTREETPLHTAASTRPDKPHHATAHEIIRVLIMEGHARVDQKNAKGETALHLAAGFENMPAVRLLVEIGANVSARDNAGLTPLHHANTAEIVCFLLEHGADIECRSDDGLTPLHHAARKNRTPVVRQLLKLGANVHARNRAGQTPLHLVFEGQYHGHAELLMLLEAGAELDDEDDEGVTAFEAIPQLFALNMDHEALEKCVDEETRAEGIARLQRSMGLEEGETMLGLEEGEGEETKSKEEKEEAALVEARAHWKKMLLNVGYAESRKDPYLRPPDRFANPQSHMWRNSLQPMGMSSMMAAMGGEGGLGGMGGLGGLGGMG